MSMVNKIELDEEEEEEVEVEEGVKVEEIKILSDSPFLMKIQPSQ